jgi:AcrR family transcriptional regulator
MSEKKLHKKKEQGAETKRKLYECARQLFTKQDYASVSVKNITDAAGVTKGTFYVHFTSKDELVASLIADTVAQLDLDYQVFLDTLPGDAPVSEILLALSERIAHVIADKVGQETMKIVYQLQLTKMVDARAIIGYNREIYAIYAGIMEMGIRRGEIESDMTPDELSQHFVMTFRGLCYEWCIRYPEFDLKEQVLKHFKLLLDGITANQ